jgi:hypothetical protein
MPRSKPVQIGQRYWEYQKDALSFYKEILNSYEIGNQLTDEDFDDIFNLLKNHPRAGEKVGCGVSELYIGSDVYAGKCFHIKRTDGSIENWLFGLCYAMDGGDKGWNPYIERHLAIFVNCF